MDWEYEAEPPSYAGEIHRYIEYVVECFRCHSIEYCLEGTKREAERSFKARGWRKISPDGWCCPECVTSSLLSER